MNWNKNAILLENTSVSDVDVKQIHKDPEKFIWS